MRKKIKEIQEDRDFIIDKYERRTAASFREKATLEDQVKDLKANLNLTGKQLIEKDKEIESKTQKLKKLQDFVDKNQGEASKISSQLSETKNDLKKLRTEYDQLKSAYKSKIDELEKIKEDIPRRVAESLDSIKSLLKTERSKVKDLKEFQKSLETKNQALEENIKALDTNYRSEQAYSKNLKEQKDKLISDFETLKEQYEQQLKVKNLTNNEIRDLQEKLKFVESDLVTEKAFSSGLTKQRDKLQEDYNDMKKKFMKLQREKNTFAKNMQSEMDKSRSERDEFEKANKDLSESLQTYKTTLDTLTEKHKKDLENQLGKLKDSNTQLEDLQSKLSKNEISIKDYKKKLRESENQFKLAKKRYEETLSLRDQKVDELVKEKDVLKERNETLEKDVTHYKSRITAKNEEIQGYLDEAKNLKETIEKLSTDISKKDLYEEQYKKLKTKFDKLTLEHNDLVHKSNQTMLDKTELEVELERLQKEIEETKKQLEETKKKMIDPKQLEESRQHVKELSGQLDQKEKELRQKVDELKKMTDEVNHVRDLINYQKEDYEKKLEKQNKENEKKLEKTLKRRKEALTAQELKAIGILLNETDVDSYANVDYQETIKKFRETRDKFKSISENTRAKLAKRLFYDKLAKHMDYRIDLLNMENGYPVETNAGRDVLNYTKNGLMGSMHRFWATLRQNKSGIIINLAIGIVTTLGTFIYMSLTKSAQAVTYIVKEVVVPAATRVVTNVVGESVIEAALQIPKFLSWLSEHAVSFTIGAISFSIAAYKEYEEESAFPILAFWSYVLAMAMYILHYAEKTYKSAKKYVPFTGDSN